MKRVIRIGIFAIAILVLMTGCLTEPVGIEDFPDWYKNSVWKGTAVLNDKKADNYNEKVPEVLSSLSLMGFSDNAEGYARATENSYKAELRETIKGSLVELYVSIEFDGVKCTSITKITETDSSGKQVLLIFELIDAVRVS